MTRILLFLSADSFSACLWKAGKLSGTRHFSNDANGREDFSNYLQTHRHPACLLVDVIEEDFRLETVPHLGGANRRQLLARKFEQYYRSTPFRQATLIQRQAEGRRDDEMLFSALTNPQRISPWLDTLLARQTPLVGIYSLPNISAPLLKGIASDHVLLLSWEKQAGLRQTYFNNKRLHFSRLIPISTHGSFTESVAAETPRTQQYLKSLSLPPPGERLDVFVICDASEQRALQDSLGENNELSYSFLDKQALSRQLKLKDVQHDSDATPLFLHLLASQTPRSHYADAGHTHFYLLWQLRRLLFGAAAIISLASLLIVITELLQGSEFVAQTAPLNAQADHVRQEVQQIQQGFSNTTVPAADMKTAVLLARQLNQYTPTPELVLRELTLVLDQFAQVRVDKLAWLGSAADAPPSPYPAQVITLDGSLSDFGSDYRGELDYLDRFQRALTQHGYTVSVTKQPLDISPRGSISDDSQQRNGSPAQFTLKIIWRTKS